MTTRSSTSRSSPSRIAGLLTTAATVACLAIPGLHAPRAAAQDLDPDDVVQPEGVSLYAGESREALVARGRTLYEDPSLSTNGMACQTCHEGFAAFLPTFEDPFPHHVAMAEARAGLDQVNAAEMVQLCMVVPMAAEPLPWESEELAALAAYVEVLQVEFAAR